MPKCFWTRWLKCSSWQVIYHLFKENIVESANGLMSCNNKFKKRIGHTLFLFSYELSVAICPLCCFEGLNNFVFVFLYSTLHISGNYRHLKFFVSISKSNYTHLVLNCGMSHKWIKRWFVGIFQRFAFWLF